MELGEEGERWIEMMKAVLQSAYWNEGRNPVLESSCLDITEGQDNKHKFGELKLRGKERSDQTLKL